MTACLRYWQAVLGAAEAELDAATTNSDLRIAARKLMRAQRNVAQLSPYQPRLAATPSSTARRALNGAQLPAEQPQASG